MQRWITRMTGTGLYQPKYSKSWALIIGIDKYRYAPPLGHARADAEGVARVLRERFAFTESNLTLIIDDAATRQSILTAFMRFATVGQDDRIFVFFAGHGHTVTGPTRGGWIPGTCGWPDRRTRLAHPLGRADA